jgi:16S rRNA (adenine1518-N6/adenine1519-N6)-dimethyltransferase
MTLQEMRRVLGESGIQLTKSLGQNFLHDANQLQRIVAAAELSKSDKVLEIGPGLGPLTELLIERAGEVLAIEKDQRLVRILNQRFGQVDQVRILHDDALRFLEREEKDWSDWKMVSNLPYSVASPILVELAQMEKPPALMVATLQWEVVRRLMAGPGSKDYGILTLLVQMTFEPGEHFKIPPGCFYPSPEVDSGCVRLVRRDSPLVGGGVKRAFVRLVKLGFSQRRKMMFKLLKAGWPEDRLQVAFENIGLTGRERAEAVSLAQFVQVAHALFDDE